MRLTNERKIYAGVLSLAVAGLLADRMFFGATPASAYAVDHSPAAPASASPSESGRQPGAYEAPIPVARLFESLSQHADNAQDGFTVPAAWQQAIDAQRALAQPKARPADEDQGPQSDPAESWARGRKLTSIVRFSSEFKAVVNGRALRLGDSLDGLTLVAIDETSGRAVFADEGRGLSVTLDLPRPGNTHR
ncbi:MAG: hypothetical protein ACK4WH_10835 [Phycisphaerales bacterium]